MKKRITRLCLPAAALGLSALAAPSSNMAHAASPQPAQKAASDSQKRRADKEWRAEIREKVDKIVMSEFGVERKRVGPDVRFCVAYGGHSINLIEFFVKLEDGFAIEIPDEDAQDIHYLRDVYAYVEKRLREREQS